MDINAIENNYNFLNLTGKSRGVGAVGTYQPYVGGGVTGGEVETTSARAVDKLPKAQKVNYEEYLPGQAGYSSGTSTWSLIG